MMGFLLDTNVISEFVTRRPEQNVSRRAEDTDETLLHLSVLTLGAIRKGIGGLLWQSAGQRNLAQQGPAK